MQATEKYVKHDLNSMTETALIILVGFLILFILLLTFRPKNSLDKTIVEWLKSMDKRLDDQGKRVNETIAKQTDQLLETQRAIYTKLQESAKSIGEMSEIGKSVKELQQFLASPKLRGGMGEQVLKVLLEESLPKSSFSLQYAFRNGVKVDAVIRTNSGIIPIDSKFSLENFKKMISSQSESDREAYQKKFVSDVKTRIDEISQKYIVSDEGTVDFALMYVPSESVYYEIVRNEGGLIDYAYKKRIMPVSPSTFYAFLRSVLISFEGQKIASEIKNIQQLLRSIQLETSNFGELLATTQTHINNSYSAMNRLSNQFTRLLTKVESVQKLEG